MAFLSMLSAYFFCSTGYREEAPNAELYANLFGTEQQSIPVFTDLEEEDEVTDLTAEVPVSIEVPPALQAASCPSIDPLDTPDKLWYQPPLSVLNTSEQELLKLKAENSLSTIVMDKILQMLPKIKLTETPKKYHFIEDALLNSEVNVPLRATVDGASIHYYPLHRWLHIIIMLNLLGSLITAASTSEYYTDLSSGSWFVEFLARVPAGYFPLAIDMYYDHWSVSSSDSLGGLYFSIANLPPDIFMRPDNKFVLCLVPTEVNIQEILRLVLHDFIAYQGLLTISVAGREYNIYCEIARLTGDISGLAELCAVLNHRALSPCRKCFISLKKIQDYSTVYPKKSQTAMKAVWAATLPKLLQPRKKTGKTAAKAKLQENGLKGIACAWLSLPEGHDFDYCTHSVACLMHNEELGLLKVELSGFWALFEKPDRDAIGSYMKQMPKIPGLPMFKLGWFDHMKSLLAKEVLTICKQILYATYDICVEDSTKLKHWECLEEHLIYFNMLGQPSLHKTLLPELHQKIVDHRKIFKDLYLKTDVATEESATLNPHVTLHYKDDITIWGLPVYYSTNHWEPKHKLLKLSKMRQTNNHYHHRDILEREWIKQAERTKIWTSNPLLEPVITPSTGNLPQKYSSHKKSVQLTFRQSLGQLEMSQLCGVILASFDTSQLLQLKYVVALHTKITPKMNLCIEGTNNEIWFGKVLKLVGYYVKLELYAVYLQVSWYETRHRITRNSSKQYELIGAKDLGTEGYIPLSSVLSRAYISSQIMSCVDTSYDLVIDSCYYVKKWHDLLDAKDL